MLQTTLPAPLPQTCFRLVRSVLACVGVCCVMFWLLPAGVAAKSKPNRAPRPEPELKVLELKISPNPYAVSAGSVEFSTLVLPKKTLGQCVRLSASERTNRSGTVTKTSIVNAHNKNLLAVYTVPGTE